ncbi:TolC family protein [Puia sp. P3]|uniref:TolC family protein n=1 Tax=Puia sp. P3 TaxID=3423952 RepID=UPI003D66AC7C
MAGAQTKDGLLDPKKAPDTLTSADLQTCVQYALKHYPLIQQALLDEQITDRQIRSRLADWYPQLNLTANYQNNFVLQQAVFSGGFTKTGVYNNSYINLGLSQTLFNRDVLLAARTRRRRHDQYPPDYRYR